MVRIRLNNSDEVLWADNAQLKEATIKHRHPPFSGELREKILYIEKSLLDVYPKSYKMWEDGFRCDLHAEKEIELWVRLCRCLNDYVERRHPTPTQRQEAFNILGACLNATPSTVFETVSVNCLDKSVAQQLADAFYSKFT